LELRAWLQANLETFSFADDPQPYVRIRAFVEALGLEWSQQRDLLSRDDHWAYRESETVPGRPDTVVEGLPAEKLFVYLQQVDPDSVRESLRQPLREYLETSRKMTEQAFLNSDLLAAARAKEDPSPLEQKLIEAAALLEEKREGAP